MATIEPRLIHLLNESTTPQLSSVDLPPLTPGVPTKSTDYPPPPIEPNAIVHPDRNGGIDGLAASQNPGSLTYGVDEPSTSAYREDGVRSARPVPDSHPLHMLLSQVDAPGPALPSYEKLSEDVLISAVDANKKRRVVKDDFVQLPQPLKKQKANREPQAVPPIINGLHEPPPDAALFPPIAASSFERRGAAPGHETLETGVNEGKTGLPSSTGAGKESSTPQKRAAKPRSKWSELETNHLLLGVAKYGVGKWKKILLDPAFSFNDRTAGDLKDRFRTCCPEEFRSKNETGKRRVQHETEQQKGPEKDLECDRDKLDVGENPHPHPGSETQIPKLQKRSRAHRKQIKDLAQLGIHAPFEPSRRRERRAFTEQEDKNILKGLEEYGPAWSKIQRDPRYGLSSRQPTDLRDRIRNGYPELHKQMERGTSPVKVISRNSNLMEPSVVTSIGNDLSRPTAVSLETHSSRTSAKEDPTRLLSQRHENADVPVSPQVFDFGDVSGQHLMGGEMDISRLLLDDSRLA